jgi:serine/threonine protein kinase
MNLLSLESPSIILENRYQIQSQLSKKSGRRTLLALDLHTNQSVIIKLLIFNAEFAWDDLKLFKREVETLKSIEHPSIPRYLDSFDVDLPNCQGFALVQSYIEAPSLAQAYQDGRRFTNIDIRQLAHALLDILIYLHEYTPSIIHRDIKPSNILIANRSSHHIGDIYLVDFGAVQGNLEQDSSTITIVGTYGYMPPEQFGGRTNPASDLYSLGATLIYLMMGIHPANLSTKDGKIQFDLDVDLALKSWLNLIIEPSLELRLKTASIAKIELDRQLEVSVTPSLKLESTSDRTSFLSLEFDDAVNSRIFINCGFVTTGLITSLILFCYIYSILIHVSSMSFIQIMSSIFSPFLPVYLLTIYGIAIIFLFSIYICYLIAGTLCYYPIASIWNAGTKFIYEICKISKAIKTILKLHS